MLLYNPLTDLWPWKPFQQRQLTCWNICAKFCWNLKSVQHVQRYCVIRNTGWTRKVQSYCVIRNTGWTRKVQRYCVIRNTGWTRKVQRYCVIWNIGWTRKKVTTCDFCWYFSNACKSLHEILYFNSCAYTQTHAHTQAYKQYKLLMLWRLQTVVTVAMLVEFLFMQKSACIRKSQGGSFSCSSPGVNGGTKSAAGTGR